MLHPAARGHREVVEVLQQDISLGGTSSLSDKPRPRDKDASPGEAEPRYSHGHDQGR
jgi:hypothetical protein